MLKQDKASVCILLLVLLLVFNPLLKSETLPYSKSSDLILQEISWKGFLKESVQQYHAEPLWYPFAFSGGPFLAKPYTGALYPLNAPFILLGDSYFAWTIAVHLLLIALFVYALARYIGISAIASLMAAGIAMLELKTVSNAVYAGHLGIVETYAWMPALFLMGERFIRKPCLENALLLAGVAAVQFTAGHTQIFLYSLIGVALYMGVRAFQQPKINFIGRQVKYLAYGVIAGLVFLAVTAIQLIPILEVSQHFARMGGVSYSMATTYQLSWEGLVSFIFPYYFGTPDRFMSAFNFWETVSYIGFLPLALIILGLLAKDERKIYVRAWGAVLLMAVLFSLGSEGGIFQIAYEIIPGVDFFRAPSRMMFIGIIAAVLLAGEGLDAIRRGRVLKVEMILVGVPLFLVAIGGVFNLYWRFTLLGLLGTSGLLLFLLSTERKTSKFARLAQVWARTIVIAVAILIGLLSLYSGGIRLQAVLLGAVMLASIVIIHMKNKELIKGKKFEQLVVMLVFVNLVIISAPLLQTIYKEEVYRPNQVVEFLKNDTERFRVLDTTRVLPQYVAGHNHIELFGGADPSTELRWYLEIANLTQTNFPDCLNKFIAFSSEVAAMMNVKYVLTCTPFEAEGLELIRIFKNVRTYQTMRGFENISEVYLYQNVDVLPRVFIVPMVRVLKTDKEVLQVLKTDFDPTTEALTTTPDAWEELAQDRNINGEAKILAYAPSSVYTEVEVNNTALLVFSEIWYPGWKAYIDGKEVELYRVNHALRAVKVERGAAVVVLRYEPRSYATGKLLTLLASLFLFTFVGWKVLKIVKTRSRVSESGRLCQKF